MSLFRLEAFEILAALAAIPVAAQNSGEITGNL
jgi:hypothetical protein